MYILKVMDKLASLCHSNLLMGNNNSLNYST